MKSPIYSFSFLAQKTNSVFRKHALTQRLRKDSEIDIKGA